MSGLDGLRRTAIYQNTIDVWIAACEEAGSEWYDPGAYRRFVAHVRGAGVQMRKFPLCVKEAGGGHARGRDKTAFAESLSASEDPDSAAYTVKLSDSALSVIRAFPPGPGGG